MKNLLVTLLISQGVPMLLAGDEIGRTQKGNNNAYCQDNDTSWLDWNPDEESRSQLNFTRKVIRIRKEHAILRRRKFFQGRKISESSKGLAWLKPDGTEMKEEVWNAAETHAIGMMLTGGSIEETDERTERAAGDTLLVLMNANPTGVHFAIPKVGEQWESLFTSQEFADEERITEGAKGFDLEAFSIAILRKIS